jgi:pyruvyltransferase
MKYKTYWFNKVVNVGDLITPYLLANLFKVDYEWVDFTSPQEKYLLVGSIIGKANSNTTVWGSGAISENLNLRYVSPTVLAVRGPLTRNLLLKNNIDCPMIYGDPGLLLPSVYSPSIKKKHKIGVVPHYVDRNTEFINYCRHNPSIKLINVQDKNIENFIDQILECEVIMSSSLHGLVIADAYKIPSVWIELSKNVIGNGFKFRDYYAAINRNIKSPHIPTRSNFNDIISDINTEFNINLNTLLKTSPFK